jgi:hypothetical protein
MYPSNERIICTMIRNLESVSSYNLGLSADIFCDYLAQGWSNCDLWATFGPQSYCENLTVILLLIYINIFLKLNCLSATNGICYAQYIFQLIKKYLNILC